MRLSSAHALRLLGEADHAVLGTIGSDGAPDLVPVCFAIDGDVVAIPVDQVKPKAAIRLQRERNLERDPRATLLVEHWDFDDWSKLWWVRASLVLTEVDAGSAADLTRRLAAKHPQYADGGIESVIPLRIVDLAGWSASG